MAPKQVCSIVIGIGGIRGLCVIGALKKLSDHWNIKNKPFISNVPGCTLKQLTGTSAGAMLIFMLSLGLSIEDIMILALNIDWKTYMQYQGVANLIQHSGLIKWDMMRCYLESILYHELGVHTITFKELHDINNIELNIVTTCITTKNIVVFNYIDTPNTSVIESVLASCSIPFIFEPIHINGNTYVDGGVTSGLPIDVAISRLPADTKGVMLCFDPRDNVSLSMASGGEIELLDDFLIHFLATCVNRCCSMNPVTNPFGQNLEIIVKKCDSSIAGINFALDKDDVHNLYHDGFKMSFDELD